jgi:hypothetical protein
MAQVALRAQRVPEIVVFRLAGAAAAVVGLIFTVGLAGILGAILRPGYPDGWSLPLQGNWLTVIYKLLAGDTSRMAASADRGAGR